MKEEAYLSGDVSKGYCDFLLLGPDKQVLEDDFKLDDTREGRKVLSDLIDEWFSQGLRQLYCGLESTGGYENNWYQTLLGLAARYPQDGPSLKVARLNPKPVKACGDAGMVRTQTDATSAYAIASYMIGWPEKILYSPREDASETGWQQPRRQAGLIRMLKKKRRS